MLACLRALALGWSVLAVPVAAAGSTWLVTEVADGDSLVVQAGDGSTQRVRISGIDAPERGQAFAAQARQRLNRLLLGQAVLLSTNKRDAYGRVVAQVWLVDAACQKASDCPTQKDVGLMQVREGWAWWYRAYAQEQSPQDRRLYAAAENSARAQRLGLWRDAQALPPWLYRRAERGQGAGR